MADSLTLSSAQQKALQQGESVPVIETGTQIECVVVRADVSNRIQRLLDFDPIEAYPALDEVMREDWSDPKMAEYDDYESRKR
jgi:hypothetical protein